jgi:phosphoribosylpyrophosphate synthetase
MLDKVSGAVVALVATIMAVFLVLLAINAALARKLRSIIPLSPYARTGGRTPPRARHRESQR